jgi:mono/diheme cytochrome c family protein
MRLSVIKVAPLWLLLFLLASCTTAASNDSNLGTVKDAQDVRLMIGRQGMVPERISVKALIPLRLEIVSVDDGYSVEIEGLGIAENIPAGETVVVNFTPNVEGSYEIHTIPDGAIKGKLVVSVCPPEFKNKKNPYDASDASLAEGKTAYEKSCAACHGIKGEGDGPLAGSLSSKPASFNRPYMSNILDGELFWIIANGLPGTEMPAFEDQIIEEQRWHLVNYVRSLMAE